MVATQPLSALALAMLFALAPFAQGHMILASPKPFGSPNNSPLDPSGGDYPCKMTSATAGEGPTNDFKVGSSQQLSFSGSAVHGGGSCQLAVTTDTNPTKDSKFKVIHSIEGGCPGVDGPQSFDFKVPDALPNGEAVFAWTWFNKIGNREMYMNCAYITVSGGKDDTAAFEKLPDLALANINVGSGASCKTSESTDFTFEGVGKNGDTVQRVGDGPFQALCGGQASPATGDSGNAGAAPSAGSGSDSSSNSGSVNNGLYTPGAGEGGAAQTPTASLSAVVSSAPASSQTSVVSSQPTDAVTSTIKTLVTVTAPTAPAPTPPQAPAASAPAAAPSGGASTGTCSSDGQLICNGEKQFGLCNHGSVVFQSVAAGTTCQGGKILRKREFNHRIQRSSI